MVLFVLFSIGMYILKVHSKIRVMKIFCCPQFRLIFYSVMVLCMAGTIQLSGQEIFIRHNQMGFYPDEQKSLLVMADQSLTAPFTVEADHMAGNIELTPEAVKTGLWGKYRHQYKLDASALNKPGIYRISYRDQSVFTFTVSDNPYQSYTNDLLAFMRQQRCGYNPYFDVVCHQQDGKLFYGPVEDSVFYDFTGGWHDAEDQLKYLITGSNATARMLLAYQISPERFDDLVDHL